MELPGLQLPVVVPCSAHQQLSAQLGGTRLEVTGAEGEGSAVNRCGLTRGVGRAGGATGSTAACTAGTVFPTRLQTTLETGLSGSRAGARDGS